MPGTASGFVVWVRRHAVVLGAILTGLGVPALPGGTYLAWFAYGWTSEFGGTRPLDWTLIVLSLLLPVGVAAAGVGLLMVAKLSPARRGAVAIIASGYVLLLLGAPALLVLLISR